MGYDLGIGVGLDSVPRDPILKSSPSKCVCTCAFDRCDSLEMAASPPDEDLWVYHEVRLLFPW